MSVVPRRSSDITPAWVETIVGKSVKALQIFPNIQEGLGFTSTVTRIQFDTIDKERKANSHHWIIKMSLFDESQPSELLDDKERSDVIEISAYKWLIPALTSLAPSLKKHLCEFVHSECTDGNADGSFIILDDMGPAGYAAVGFSEILEAEHFDQGIRFLAELHTASQSLETLNSKPIPDQYAWFPNWHLPDPNGTITSVMHSRFCGGFKDVEDILRQSSSSPEIGRAYRELELHADAVFKLVLNAPGKKCVIHGDLWPSNILVHPRREAPIKVIDFQMMGYGDSAYDLAPFVLSGLSAENLNLSNILRVALRYYEEYNQLNLPETSLRTSEEFAEFFKTYGLAYGLIWFVIGWKPISKAADSTRKLVQVLTLLVEVGVVRFLLSMF